MKRRVVLTILSILFSAFASGPGIGVPGIHLSQPALGVWPEFVNLPVGSTFQVSVNVTEVTDLVAYEVTLLFDTTVLDVLSATLEGTWFDVERPDQFLVLADEVSDPLGELHFSIVLLGDAASLTGSGILLFAEFRAVRSGSTRLDLLTDEEQLGPALANSFVEAIPHDTIDGIFNNVGPGQIPPLADFSFSPPEPQVGDAVVFDASASNDIDGTIIAYTWQFSDGTSAITETDPFIEHVFQTATGIPLSGTFPVTLTVRDDKELVDSRTRTVIVGEIGVPGTPSPIFTFLPADPVAGETVAFDASASEDPDGGLITGYFWLFGDGFSTEGVEAGHVYTQPGVFTVTLRVVDDEGEQAVATRVVSVALAAVGLTMSWAEYPRMRLFVEGPTQVLYAEALNVGNVPVLVYARFTVTGLRDESVVVFQTSLQGLDVRERVGLSVSFEPQQMNQWYSVQVGLYFSPRNLAPDQPGWFSIATGELSYHVIAGKLASGNPSFVPMVIRFLDAALPG